MKKLFLMSIISLITACSHAPEPLSWKNDLNNIKEEPINQGVDTKEIYYELNKKSVWK